MFKDTVFDVRSGAGELKYPFVNQKEGEFLIEIVSLMAKCFDKTENTYLTFEIKWN